MIALIASEWQRIQGTTVFALVLHVLVLAILANYGLLYSNNLGLNVALTSAYGVAAAIFGALQVGSYLPMGSWLFLINRPMPPCLIFLSLVLSASLFFLVVLIFPWMFATLCLQAFSNNVIEFRHFLQLPYLFGIAISFYLAGVLITLSRNKLVAVLLWLPLLSILSLHAGGNVMTLLAMVTGLMLLLALFFFKPAIGSRPRDVVQVGMIAVAIQLSCFLAITAITKTTGQVIEQNFAKKAEEIERHDQVASRATARTYQQTVRLDGQQKVVSGLSGLPADQVEPILRTVLSSEVFQVKKAVSFLPTRQQIPFVHSRGLTLDDNEHDVIWEFSHSVMQFLGHRTDTGKHVGRLGPDGVATPQESPLNAGRFPFVPWIAGMQLACGNNLYRFNDESQSIELLFELADDQTLQSPLLPRGSVYTLVSDRELYLFDGIEIEKNVFPFRVLARIELPDDYNNLRDVSLVELRDDYLVSFLYGKDERARAYDAAQFTYRVGRDGNLTFLNQRKLARDVGPVMSYLPSLISPLGEWVVDLAPIHPGRDRYLKKRASVFRWPASIFAIIGLLAACNIAITFWLARNRGLGLLEKCAWAITSGLTGIPGIISFLALTKIVPKHLCAASPNSTGAVHD